MPVGKTHPVVVQYVLEKTASLLFVMIILPCRRAEYPQDTLHSSSRELSSIRLRAGSQPPGKGGRKREPLDGLFEQLNDLIFFRMPFFPTSLETPTKTPDVRP